VVLDQIENEQFYLEPALSTDLNVENTSDSNQAPRISTLPLTENHALNTD